MKDIQITSGGTDRKIVQLASMLAALFLVGFWTWALISCRPENWGVLDYVLLWLSALALIVFPFHMAARQGRMRVAGIFVYIISWLFISPLVAASILCSIHVWQISETFTDGNDFTDPVEFTLSCLTPIALLGVAGLFFLWRRGFNKKHSFSLAVSLLTVCTLVLFAFGVWFLHGMDASFRLSNQVWWLWPGRFLGI
jgi:hypothetical protein